jgi:hypothetical protein
LEKLELEDFSGGITDHYLNAPENKSRQLDNLLISKSSGTGKPFTRPGSEILLSADPRPVSNRIGAIFEKLDNLFVQSATKIFYLNGSTWTDLLAYSSSAALDAATTASVLSYSYWNNHIIYTHYNDDLATWGQPFKIHVRQSTGLPELNPAGLPCPEDLGSGAQVIANLPGGAEQRAWALVFRRSYTLDNQVTFQDRSAPQYISVNNGSLANTYDILWDAPPVPYRQNEIVMEIYRTTNGGTTFYLEATIPALTEFYLSGSVADIDLVNNAVLYATDGRSENDLPPQCKMVHVFNDACYYGNIKENALSIIPNRVLQSLKSDIDSVPADYYIDFDADVTGLSSTRSNLIVMTTEAIYRVDGEFDDYGRGGMISTKISDATGCISPQSVVQTMDGVFWAGANGIYFTDGNNVIRLNGDYDKSWANFISTGGLPDETKRRRLQGKYDRSDNRIWWTTQTESSNTDSDSCYVLDLNWGIRENATFTTFSGVTPTAIEFDEAGGMYRGDTNGIIFYHADTLYSDPRIDLSVSPESSWATAWGRQPIFWTYETIGFNFGTSFSRKYVPTMSFTAQAPTNLSLQIISNNDDGKTVSNLAPVRFRGVTTWSDPDVYWGDPSLVWNYTGLVAEKRHFPAKSLRCNYKSLIFQNAKVNIVNSDLVGLAAVNSGAKTATLSGAFEWPSNSVDYYIAFESDGYDKEYLVTIRTPSTLTYSDAANTSVTAAASKWILRGYPKNEILNLLNFSIGYEMFGRTQDVANKTDVGDNA